MYTDQFGEFVCGYCSFFLDTFTVKPSQYGHWGALDSVRNNGVSVLSRVI